MATEPITVEVVCPECGGTNNEQFRYPQRCPDCRGDKTIAATLAPGSRSEKVQRLGEAAWAVAEADAEGAAHPSREVAKRWLDAADEYDAALVALRQHDTEHGRNDA